MPRDDQSRKWHLTINNPAEKGFTHAKIKEELSLMKSTIYFCLSDEKGETPHTHIFFQASSPVRFSTVKSHFPTAHIEKAQGSAEENKAYIQKSGKWEHDDKHGTQVPGAFEEWGAPPISHQGERTDLAVLYEMVKDGLSNFEIMEANPDYLLTLDKIERARQAVREQQYRSTFRNLDVTYICGKTGVGKTRSVMEKYGYSSVYRVTDYAHPFDSYMGEDVLILDEYNSNFRIQDLLNYLDGYPLTLPCRYTNRVACFTKVYIISNLCLSKQYTDIQFSAPVIFNALLRRIHKVVRYTGVNIFVVYATEEYMDDPFLKTEKRSYG